MALVRKKHAAQPAQEAGVPAAEPAAEPTTEHGAAEYAAALNTVADMLEYAAQYLPTKGTAGKVAGVAKGAVPSLRALAARMPEFAPFIDAAVEQAPGVARAAGEAAAAAGGAVTDAADSAAHAFVDPVKAQMLARRAEKERRDARRMILEGARITLPVSDFEEERERHVALVAGSGSAALFPGCYVIVRAPKSFVRDASEYQDVYVGCSGNMWDAVADELAGYGNPDVYADVKYKAGVYILLYPYPEQQLAAARQGLIVALGADVSYNARELAPSPRTAHGWAAPANR